MSRHRPRAVRLGAALTFLAVAAFGLAGCATAPGAGQDASPAFPLGAVWPAPPDGEVVAQGTVMDVAGDVQLCLGAVMESYPPQCRGIPLEGWSWDGVEGSESAGETTWGAYAVTGTYDGETFTATQPPIMLALYDPIRPEDPSQGVAGRTPEARLVEIQEELPDRLGAELLSSYPDRGYLWVQVVWDDGTLQDAADAEYGPEVVFIESAMRQFD